MASSGIFHTISGEDLDVIMDLIDQRKISWEMTKRKRLVYIYFHVSIFNNS